MDINEILKICIEKYPIGTRVYSLGGGGYNKVEKTPYIINKYDIRGSDETLLYCSNTFANIVGDNNIIILGKDIANSINNLIEIYN